MGKERKKMGKNIMGIILCMILIGLIFFAGYKTRDEDYILQSPVVEQGFVKKVTGY